MTATGTEASTDTQTVELDVAGMTCAACANRVELALGKLDGVRASVNYATQRAIVTGPGAADIDRLVQQVESAGYGARSEERRVGQQNRLTMSTSDHNIHSKTR